MTTDPDIPVQSRAATYPGLRSPAVAPAARVARAEPKPPADRDGVVPASAVLPTVAAPPAAVAENTIDLGVALRLAGVDNPTINLARERVEEAVAAHLAARALLLPSINVGGNFRRHRGALQSATGQIREVDLQNLYLGAGAGAVGSGTVTVPGVRLFAHLGDAVYEPLAARQRLTARTSDAHAVRNAVLLDVATAYLELAGAEARRDVLRRGETDVAEVLRLTEAYAEAGQGRRADVNRVAANAELVRRDLRRAEEDVAVASARVCGLLSLDPSVRLRTPGGSVEPLRLVPEDGDPEPLVAAAVRARPEIFARSAEVLEATTRVRQEQVRPWVPTVSVGYSGGAFGAGGSGRAQSADIGTLQGRSDFDVYAVWTAQNLGLGNRARVRTADAGVGRAAAGYDDAVNRVRREVVTAQAEARAAARQTDVARTAVAAAEDGFRLETERIRQGQGRPIETLDSFRQLLDARQELIRAVVAFDTAQFRLLVAVGNDPRGAGTPPAPP